MAKGGARPGAGRPRKYYRIDQLPASLRQLAGSRPLMPLDFLLDIMRNEQVAFDVRVRCATFALPYCHPKMYDRRYGKRDAALDAARDAADTGEWADELGADPRAAN